MTLKLLDKTSLQQLIELVHDELTQYQIYLSMYVATAMCEYSGADEKIR